MNVEAQISALESQYRKSKLTQIYDYLLASCCLLCALLDLCIIVLTYFADLRYFIALAGCYLISCIIVFITSCLNSPQTKNDAYWCLASCLFFVQASVSFVWQKLSDFYDDDDDEDDDRYFHWKWTEDRMRYHLMHFAQLFAQNLPQFVMHLIMVAAQARTLEGNESLHLLLYISIALFVCSFGLMLITLLVRRLNTTFTTVSFCAFCIFTDAVGAVMVVLFLFYDDNDHVSTVGNNAALASINIYGQLFALNWFICILPVSAVLIIAGIVPMFDEIGVFSGYHWTSVACFIIFGLPIYLALALVVSVLSQFCVFSLLVIFIAFMLTARFDDVSGSKALKHSVTTNIAAILNFVENGAQSEKMMRLVVVNYALYEVAHADNQWQMRNTMNKLNFCKENESLRDVTFARMREYVGEPTKSSLTRRVWEWYTVTLQDYKLQIELEKQVRDWCSMATHTVVYILGWLLLFVLVPLWAIGKLFSMASGWIYLAIAVGHRDTNAVASDTYFLLACVCLYLALQLLVPVFGYFMYKQQYILWHVACGVSEVEILAPPRQFLYRIMANYKELEWIPAVKNMLMDMFGEDVGVLIFKYTMTMNITQELGSTPLNDARKKVQQYNTVVHDSGVAYQYGSLFND